MPSIIDQSTALNEQKTFWDGFFQSIKGGWKGVRDYIKNFFFDWLLKQLSQQFTMNVLVTGGGGVNGIASAVGNLFGGGGGLLGGVGSAMGSVSGLLGFGSGGGILGSIAAGTNLAVTGLLGGGLSGLAGGIGTAVSAGLLPALGALGPIVGGLVAVLSSLGVFTRNNGFKIDNNLTSVGNPSSHFKPNAISPFDISGRGTDSPEIQAALKPFVTAIQAIDALLANNLLGADTLAAVRANINRINNESSWRNLDAAGIEAGSKEFLIKRYGAIFDEVDAKLAASIRGFTGTADELLKFIGSTVGVMQTLQTNALLFKQVIGETISLGQLSALSKEGESLADTLTRVVNAFTLTSEIASIMGKGADAFGAVGLASLEARERLVTLAGGLQALSTGVSFYVEKFFTDEERLALARKNAQATVDQGFAALNLAVPQSRDAFRSLIDGIDLTTQAGQALLVALLKLAPSLDLLLPGVTQRTQSPYDPSLAGENIQIMGRNGIPITKPREPEHVAATDAYLNAFYTAAERAAMKLAADAKLVNDTFASYDRQVPTTMAGFRQLLEGIDRSTEAGERFYQVIMSLAPAFANVNATTVAVDRTDQYLNEFFTEQERRAMALAASGKTVNEGFAALGLTAPTTRAEFRRIVEGLDLTTEAGRRTWNALIALVPAFADITAAAQELINLGVSVGAVLDAGTQTAAARLAQLFAIIDSTGESTSVKLQRKLSAASALAAELDASYRAQVRLRGGLVDADALATRAARDAVLAQQATLAGDLALLVSLQAQYGSYADQMFTLEKWRQDQIAIANGSAAQLLLIEQSYTERRNAILAGGVATGLNSLSTQLRDWLNNLLLSDQLSTLTPEQRLAEAQRQYDAALTGTDAGAITSAADAYLREARSFYASGDAYSAIFSGVIAAITGRASAPVVLTGTATGGATASAATSSAAALASASASTATAAATSAIAAAEATTLAINQAKDVIAEMIAQSKNAITTEAATTRAADVANTSRVVAAVSDRSTSRVLL